MYLHLYNFNKISDINNILEQKISKANNIDCIPANKVKQNKSFETLFCKTLSAMANTSDSVLFLGVSCVKGVVSKKENIDNKITSIYIHNIINKNLLPIPEYEISEINGVDNHIFVIKIKSSSYPSMMSDGRFYFRRNNKNAIMQENDLRNFYSKNNFSNIDFVGVTGTSGVPSYNNGLIERIMFFPKFFIKNTGNKVEQFYKVVIKIPASIHDTNFIALHNYFSHYDNNYIVFSIPAKSPLFQNEMYMIAEAKLQVDSKNFDDFKNGKIYINVYHSEGSRESVIDLYSSFIFNKKTLSLNEFLMINS